MKFLVLSLLAFASTAYGEACSFCPEGVMDGATLPDFPDIPDIPTGMTCATLKGIAESGLLSAEDCAGTQSLSAYCCPTCLLCGEGNVMTKPNNIIPPDDTDDPTTCAEAAAFAGLAGMTVGDQVMPECSLILAMYMFYPMDVQTYCGCENAPAPAKVCDIPCDEGEVVTDDPTAMVASGLFPCYMGQEYADALKSASGSCTADVQTQENKDACCVTAPPTQTPTQAEAESSATPTMLGFLLASVCLAIALIE